MTYDQGQRTEYFVMHELTKRSIQYTYVDDWYDITAGDTNERIEIKSTHLFVKSGKNRSGNPKRMAGQFNFKDDHNRQTQRSENVWYAFVLVHHGQYILLGFQRARLFPDKRYLSWVEVSRHALLSADDFADRIRSTITSTVTT